MSQVQAGCTLFCGRKGVYICKSGTLSRRRTARKGRPSRDVCFRGSIGGLKIDTSTQVIDRVGEPIAHLFAAGANAGGYLGPYYPGSGIMLQSACHTGRVAGYSAAALAGAGE